MVSECLTNAGKHGGARRADVDIGRRKDRLVIKVIDDGRGFTPEQAIGSGLSNLLDRIEAIGGRLEVSSRPGGGTAIIAELPYATTAANDATSPTRRVAVGRRE